MGKAILILDRKTLTPEGEIVQMRIWQVPAPVLGSRHDLKYSLFYGKAGQRIVGFDNERGKGDHCHIGNRESPYEFVSVERLIRDFIRAVRAQGGTV